MDDAWNPLIRPLSRRDLQEAKRAQEAFGAVGSFDLEGNFEPNIAQPNLLALLMPISREKLDALWHHIGIKTDGTSAYHDVMASDDGSEKLFHCAFVLSIGYYKVKRGLFSYRWVGDVRIVFGPIFKREQVYIGTIAGDTQKDMWEHLRSVLAEMDRPFDGTMNAIAARKGLSKPLSEPAYGGRTITVLEEYEALLSKQNEELGGFCGSSDPHEARIHFLKDQARLMELDHFVKTHAREMLGYCEGEEIARNGERYIVTQLVPTRDGDINVLGKRARGWFRGGQQVIESVSLRSMKAVPPIAS